jgi:carbonic anhydrase
VEHGILQAKLSEESLMRNVWIVPVLVVLLVGIVPLACKEEAPATTEPETSAAQPSEEAHGEGHGEEPYWCYKPQEPCGPEHWGSLNPEEWALCDTGEAQSPVDITGAEPADSAPVLELAYNPTPVVVQNNGHAIEVAYAEGSTLDLGDGRPYGLLQFHFHNPSEHTIEGAAAPMEVHLVHGRPAADGEGTELAVIGLLFDEGDENAFLAQFWNAIPVEEGANDAGVEVNVLDLLPPREYYHLQGSLTTPGCGQGVQWFVLREHSTASAEQVAKLNEAVGQNARPVQALNGRKILEGPAG